MKYMGSKNRIAKYIIPILEKSFKENNCIDFIDTCVGGANLIDKVNFTNNLFAYDINEYLIEMWNELKKGWIPELISKDEYIHIKNNKHLYPKYLIGWVGIACSYSGKWFGGYAGDYPENRRLKNGLLPNYQNESINTTQKQITNLNNVTFKHNSLFDLKPINKSLIYCDIPYRWTTKYKDDFNHDEFYKWCFKMKELGHVVFISEYEMPSEFKEVWKGEVKSSLSANGKIGGSKKSIEKLFTI